MITNIILIKISENEKYYYINCRPRLYFCNKTDILFYFLQNQNYFFLIATKFLYDNHSYVFFRLLHFLIFSFSTNI